MPIYRAKIKVINLIDVPVAADSPEEAMEYLKSHTCWHESGQVASAITAGLLVEPESVDKINSPKEVAELFDMGATDLCWGYWQDGEDRLKVARAFYAERFNRGLPEGDDDSDWGEYFEWEESTLAGAVKDFSAGLE